MFVVRKRNSCHMCGETHGTLVRFGDYYFCSFECFEKFANSIPMEEFKEMAEIDTFKMGKIYTGHIHVTILYSIRITLYL